MPATTPAVIGGIDCHTDFHVAAAIDPLGPLLDTRSFPATSAGYRDSLHWLVTFGRIIAVGVESTGSFGAGLARSLIDAGCRVIEINQPHPHTSAARQERFDRCRGSGTQGALRRSDRHCEGHHRNR